MALFLIPTLSSAQINPVEEKDRDAKIEKVGEAKKFGLWLADLTRIVTKESDTTYTIFFNNAKYTTITDVKKFSFNETGGDLEKLYQIIITGLENKEKKEVDIPLKDGKLTLVFTGKWVSFRWFSLGVLSYSAAMNNIHIKKLFGKEVKDEDYDK